MSKGGSRIGQLGQMPPLKMLSTVSKRLILSSRTVKHSNRTIKYSYRTIIILYSIIAILLESKHNAVFSYAIYFPGHIP